MLIDILSFGVVIPVLPGLVREFTGGDFATASCWVGIFGTLFAAIQFVTSPIQGTLSDRFGRRPVILLSCFGLGMDFILMALSQLVARGCWRRGCFSGDVLGQFHGTANAYIADVTAAEKRAQAYGMLGAAFGVGFHRRAHHRRAAGQLGPARAVLVRGGPVIAEFPVWLVRAARIIAARRSARRASTGGTPIRSARWACWRRFPQVVGLVAVVLIANLPTTSTPACPCCSRNTSFGWNEQQVSWMLALVGICSAIVQAGLVGRLVPLLGERRTLLLGLACGVSRFHGLSASPEPAGCS